MLSEGTLNEDTLCTTCLDTLTREETMLFSFTLQRELHVQAKVLRYDEELIY